MKLINHIYIIDLDLLLIQLQLKSKDKQETFAITEQLVLILMQQDILKKLEF